MHNTITTIIELNCKGLFMLAEIFSMGEPTYCCCCCRWWGGRAQETVLRRTSQGMCIGGAIKTVKKSIEWATPTNCERPLGLGATVSSGEEENVRLSFFHVVAPVCVWFERLLSSPAAVRTYRVYCGRVPNTGAAQHRRQSRNSKCCRRSERENWPTFEAGRNDGSRKKNLRQHISCCLTLRCGGPSFVWFEIR